MIIPVFQIVQMDPDAAKWLGFAKQQCKRIMSNGTQDFYREWPLDGATVKAKSYGGTVKLWLVAGVMKLYYGVAVTIPCPGRTLSIVMVVYPSVTAYPDMGSGYAWSIPRPTPSYDVDTGITIIVPPGGTWPDGTYAPNGGVCHLHNVVNGLVSSYSFYSGSYYYVEVYGGGWSLMSAGDVTTVDYLPQMVAAADAYNAEQRAANASAAKTVILLSDDTQLASFPYTVLDTQGHKANYPLATTWSGDGWLDLYTDTYNGSTWTPVFSQRVTFTVPADVVIQKNAYPGGLPAPNRSGYQYGSYTFSGAYGGYYYSYYSTDPPLVCTLRTVLNGQTKSSSVLGTWQGTDGIGYNHIPNSIYYNAYPGFLNPDELVYSVNSDIGAPSAVVLMTISFANAQANAITDIGDAEYKADLNAWFAANGKSAADWVAAQAVALRRERARRKICSDNLKMQLQGYMLDSVPLYQHQTWIDAQKADAVAYNKGTSTNIPFTSLTSKTSNGTTTWYISTAQGDIQLSVAPVKGTPSITNEMRYPIKTLHPRSLNTYMQGKFTVSTVTATIADDNLGNTTIQKTVTMRYTPPPVNGVTQSQVTQTQVGTKQTEIIWYSSNGMPKTASATKVTYTKWTDLVDTDGSSSKATPINTAVEYHDSSKLPLMQMMDGINFNGPGLYDVSGYAYTPTPPPSSDTTVITTHPFFTQFRQAYKPSYDKTGKLANTNFLDSKLVDGELIDVIPVSVVHSTLGDLGIFSYVDDIADKYKLTLKVDVKATFKYHYVDGSFTFVGSNQITDPKTDITYLANTNCVFLSKANKSMGWPDVMGDPKNTANYSYLYQQKRLAAPSSQPQPPTLTADEQLFQAISKLSWT